MMGMFRGKAFLWKRKKTRCRHF